MSIPNKKGQSLIAFPDSYVIIDFETTGLDREYDDIIEMAAIKVRNGAITDTFSSLINPDYQIDDFITYLTGITNEMLKIAPEINTVMPKLLSFIGNDIIVGHNVSFDIGFLCTNVTGDVLNDYVDTLRLSRKLYKDMQHHRLIDMVEALNIPTNNFHRALDDCYTTYELFMVLNDKAISEYGDVETFRKMSCKRSKSKSIDIASIIAEPGCIDEDNLFYNKECAFTGTLEKMKRADAMQLVINIGGRVGNGVTKKTNYLILGNNDYCKSIKGVKSSKQKKAEQLKLQGQDIEIISEQVFYDAMEM